MNELQVFSSAEFGEIRTAEIEDKIYFCASDVAKALGYTNPNKAINDHCRAITKRATPISGKMQEINYIPEGDVYRLITHSKLASAERFEVWVFDEVLPSIRKHGGYIAGQEDMSDEDLLAKALLVANSRIKEREKALSEAHKQIEADKPKVLFADAVSASHTSILVGDLAKILKQNGVEMGARRLFDWMREKGFLIKQRGASYNMPTQRAMEMGLFEIKETVIAHADGHTSISKTPKITGKGQQYFVNLFLVEKVS